MDMKKQEPALKYDAGKPAFELLDEDALPFCEPGHGSMTSLMQSMQEWTHGGADELLRVAFEDAARLLCPEAPQSAMRLEIARILEYGAQKYEAHNWRKGMSWSRVYGAAMRHIEAFTRGDVINHEHHNDRDFYCHHLGSAGCCLMFLIAYQRDNVGTDDRYQPTAVTDPAAGWRGCP